VATLLWGDETTRAIKITDPLAGHSIVLEHCDTDMLGGPSWRVIDVLLVADPDPVKRAAYAALDGIATKVARIIHEADAREHASRSKK